MKHERRVVNPSGLRGGAFLVLALSSFCACGCGEAHESEVVESDALSDGEELIWYRGEQRIAQRFGEHLVIEGDIEVGPADVWGGPEDRDESTREMEGVGVTASALKIQGANFQWPGDIPYTFGSSTTGDLAGAMSAAEQAAVLAAMDDWEERVPGLNFVQRNGETDYIRFNLSATSCRSAVGRQGNEQTIRLTTGCLGTASVHHEIGHALGIFHQHTRRDRNAFVQVNWGNIRGCTAAATGPNAAQGCGTCTAASFGGVPAGAIAPCGCTQAQFGNGSCNSFSNFASDTARTNIGPYDYGSVMHYPSTSFSKPGAGATLVVLQNDPATGAPFAIGQRVAISAGDALAMRAMYPVARVHRTFFQNTGEQELCVLGGRNGDRLGTQFNLAGDIAGSFVDDGLLDTALPVGDYQASCTANSLFWNGNYSYPNTSVAFSGAPTNAIETYQASANVRVLDAGLIAVLFD